MHHTPTATEVIGCLCMIEWGLIHIGAGVMTLSPSLTGDLAKYFDRVMMQLKESPKFKRFEAMQAAGSATEDTEAGWPFLCNRILLQHSLNLGFVGVQAIIAAFAILDTHAWRHCYLVAFPAFWFDIGYFVAIDIPELGGLFAQAQTYIVSVGMIMAALSTKKYHDMSGGEFGLYMFMPIAFMTVALVTKVLHVTGKGWTPLKASAPLIKNSPIHDNM